MGFRQQRLERRASVTLRHDIPEGVHPLPAASRHGSCSFSLKRKLPSFTTRSTGPEGHFSLNRGVYTRSGVSCLPSQNRLVNGG